MTLYKDMAYSERLKVRDLYFDLFAGRLDTYAIRIEGEDRAMYLPSQYTGDSEWSREKVDDIVSGVGSEMFGDEAIHAHLAGDYLLGAYPIQTDGKVRWFALDFDGKNGDPYTEAVAQAMVFMEEAKLVTHIERSQGGNGYHVWGFLDQPIEAYKLRHALKPFIERTDTYDRMFPNQDSISETRPLGNLIALPLSGQRVDAGNSVFVYRGKDGAPVVYEDQFAFLRDKVVRNSTARIEELFQMAGQFKPERTVTKYTGDAEGLADGWKVTHPRFGCEFMRWAYDNPSKVDEPLWYAIACNLAQLSDGRELFHQISAQDFARYDEAATNKKYDQAVKQNKPHTCEKIREIGGNCECDFRFRDIKHPFEVAKIPFKQMVETITAGQADTEAVLDASAGFDAAIRWLELVQEDPTIGQGRKYGIPGLDKYTGLRDSDLIIIAARPGMGKTALMNTVVDNSCMEGVPNYVFSAEMSSLQFFKRQLSTRAGVSQTRMTLGLLDKEEWATISAAAKTVRGGNYPLFVDDLSRSTERIFETAARLVHTHGKGIVWVDYLQLLQRNPQESMFDAVTRITHDLKLLAKALGVPVVALTQLNRTADDATAESQTEDSWLRGSGDIEQTADVIIFMLGEKGPLVQGRVAALHKERHRESGHRIELEFNQPIMRFADRGTWGVAIPGPNIKRPADAPRVDDGEMTREESRVRDVRQLVGEL